MRIEFVEIANFRKLRSIRTELAADKTVFVGENILFHLSHRSEGRIYTPTDTNTVAGIQEG